MSFVRKLALVSVLLLSWSKTTHAILLDWSTVTWTPGATSASFDIDPARAGNDITITFSSDTNKLRSDPASGVNTPAILTSLEGGRSPVDQSLHVAANVGTKTTITVTVTFSALYLQGVENVSFALFDIDKTTDSEFIINMGATTVTNTQLAANVTGLGSAASLSGAGLTQIITGNASSVDAGAGSGNGNATIGFGPTAIRSFTFTFDNGPGPPRVQEFALYDISFTPVPEINPVFAAGAFCGAAAFVRGRRRRPRRKTSTE